MTELLNYRLERATGTAELRLTDQRLVVKTEGKGLLDKPQTIDILLTDLGKFCLVPTIGAQNIAGGTGAQSIYDSSYDSEFIFSYQAHGKLQRKRVFVNSRDETFQRFLQALENIRPEASLLHLEPVEAQKQIGALSATKTVYIIIGLLIGVPLVVIVLALLLSLLFNERSEVIIKPVAACSFSF